MVAILGAGARSAPPSPTQFGGEADTDLVLSDVSAASLQATTDGLPEAGAAVETVIADVSDVAAGARPWWHGRWNGSAGSTCW